MNELLKKIEQCRHCEQTLPHEPRPVVRAASTSRVIIIGQAPGSRVHNTGIPWNDPSGDLLRQWMGVTKTLFYQERYIALMPMGFCYPGKGKSGDLPPMKPCAPLWHTALQNEMGQQEITLLIGQYAQRYYLKDSLKKNLTETVRHFQDYLPRYFPLPHPSPRNRIWLKKNPWFEQDVLPVFRQTIQRILT